jgi:SAM-dependent methyltransferase
MDVKTSVEAVFNQLSDLARVKTPFFSEVWPKGRQAFGPAWAEEVVDNVTRLFGTEEDGGWERAIRGYAEFALDAMRNQKFFETNGRYRWSRLADIHGRYYESEEHMMKNYLPGMWLSHYLWPHHFRMLSFFREEVRAQAPNPSLFYDVGIGTGMYSREMLKIFSAVRGKGFDISEYSARFTTRALKAYGLESRYEVSLGNIFTAPVPAQKADFVVSQEVLEHLEDPDRFLRILREMAKDKAYITAAINAGHTDHIYLFRSAEEVVAMLERAGWKILKWHAEVAYEGMPLELTPSVAGFFCQREGDRR